MNLIKKERMIPLGLQKCEALLRRLDENHPKWPFVEKRLAKYKKGFEGEQSLDYFFSDLPKSQYYLFHDLRLPVGENKFAQFDTVLLSKSFLLIIEVKNIVGTIIFDRAFSQLIRIKDGQEEAFPDPILQLNRQKKMMRSILKTKEMFHLPIETIIVMTNPATLLKSTGNTNEVGQIVIRSTNLLHKIEHFETKYKKPQLTTREVNKLSRYFNKYHSPLNPDILSQYKIGKLEIQTGVHCPHCNHIPIQKHPNRNKWHCNKCNQTSNDAHLHSLRDYALLISESITNKECRRFLHLPSTQSAYRLLNTFQLEFTGTTKGRRYKLQTLIDSKKAGI